jgi:hypothetical protein
MSEEREAAECPAERGIKEIWRRVPGDFYSPSIEAFPHDGPMGPAIRISVGGSVVTMPVEQWHYLARHADENAIDHSARIQECATLRARLEAVEKENHRLMGKYGSQEVQMELIDLLTKAGCGKPGTANTLWAMVKEIIALAATRLADLEKAREYLYSLSVHRAGKCDTDECPGCVFKKMPGGVKGGLLELMDALPPKEGA